MTRTSTRRLTRSIVLAGAAVFAGLLFGRLEFLVLATPFVVVVTWSLLATAAPVLAVEAVVSKDRCLEGDEIEVEIQLRSDRRVDEVEIGVVVPSGFRIARGAKRTITSLPAGALRTMRVRLRAVRWGSYRLGNVAVRVGGPGRFVLFEELFDRAVPIKVFPAFEQVSRGVLPPVTQLFAGDHVARAAGEGIEFADVRPFAPGDRVRRINWKVSSRRGALSVNLHHPERNADVVLLLDTFADVGPPGCSSLDLAVRGAAVLARHYLGRKDRVGLVSFGGLLHWLSASHARTQIYRIVDYLLEVDVQLSYAWKDIQVLPRGTLPPLALVIAFSPLEDERALNALVDLRSRGFPVIVVDTVAEELVAPMPGAPGAVAHHAWRLAREGVHFRFATLGIPVVGWSGRESLQAALAAVPMLGRRERAGR